MANSAEFGTSNGYIVYWFEMIQNWQSVEGNYSNVTVRMWVRRTNSGYTTYGTGTAYVNINGGAYSAGIGTGQKITNNPIVLFETNVNIGHNGDGTGRVDVSGSISHSQFSSGNNAWGFGLDTIPRASVPTLNINSQEMGKQITIYTNRKSAAFKHTLVCSFGDQTFNIAFEVDDSFTWTLPLSLANAIPSANQGWGGIIVHTYNNGQHIGTNSVVFYANTPASMIPSLSSVTHSENVADVKTKVGAYVQNMSKLNLGITGAAGTYGSWITKQEIIVDGVAYGNGGVSNPLKSSGTVRITGRVTDSRGRVAEKAVDITVLSYAPPSITALTLQRAVDAAGTLGELGTYAKVTRSGNWSPLNGKNTLTIVIKSKNRGAGSWTTKNTFNAGTSGNVSGSTVVGTYSATTSHDFQIEFTDIFNTTISLAVLATGQVTMSWGKTGIGLGKIWEQGGLDVAGGMFVDGIEVVGNAGQPTPNNNLNTTYKQGRYMFDPTTVGKTPFGSYGVVEVVVSNGSLHNNANNWIWQFAYSTDSISRLSFRHKVNGGNWTEWTKLSDDKPILCKVSAFGIQNMQPKIWQRLDFNSIDSDNWGIFNDSTNLFTVPETGWYEFTISMHNHQSVGTGLDIEIWGPAASLNKAVRVVTGYAPANGWNYWFGSVYVFAYAGTGCEFVAKHGDGDYARLIHGIYATVRKM